MSIFVYRNANSDSARELAMSLGGRKIRSNERLGFYYKNREGVRVRLQFTPRDIVVGWGEAVPNNLQARVLNGAPIRSKFSDAQRLREAGVPTIEVSQTRPVVIPAPPPIDPAIAAFEGVRELIEDFPAAFGRSRVIRDGVQQLRGSLDAFIAAIDRPAPVAPAARVDGEWLARMNNHVGGTDLLTPPARADFFVRKLDLIREFRVHSFAGVSIRAGVKRERVGFPNVHPWIRSFDAGWQISYDGVSANRAMRELAHRAVAALGLQFGAVDIGEKRDGSGLVVLEVNRAPGLADGTVARYSNAILRWSNNELEAQA